MGEVNLRKIYEDNIFMMTRAVEPTEIIWKNMKGRKGLFIIRRSFFFVLGLIIVLFGTTPVVILGEIEKLFASLGFTRSETYDLLVNYL